MLLKNRVKNGLQPVMPLARAIRAGASIAIAAAIATTAIAEEKPAKQLFGAVELPADQKTQAVGFYSKGCMAGAMAIPVDGPDWQVMRLSRNRRWGHPDLIRVIEELSLKAKRHGWNGLLVGDMSQPRGGPMLTGHASHQIGLDVDIWFMPMPDKRLTYEEREETSAISVLKDGSFYVDDKRWTPAHADMLREAASFREVERILVHPGVKKKLCQTVGGDRGWLQKIRPYYGHNYHFHLRIGCPKGSSGCKQQAEVAAGDGCDKALDWWFDVALQPKKPKKPEKQVKPREITLSDLPGACAKILAADAVPPEKAEYRIKEAAFGAPEIVIPAVDPLAILTSKPIEGKKANR
jgi:penicillin-insensitive murein endopeptidase